MDTTNLPKTREEAKKTGNKYYFTGQPCKHGHIAARKTKGACVECLKVEWAKGKETRALKLTVFLEHFTRRFQSVHATCCARGN